MIFALRCKEYQKLQINDPRLNNCTTPAKVSPLKSIGFQGGEAAAAADGLNLRRVHSAHKSFKLSPQTKSRFPEV